MDINQKKFKDEYIELLNQFENDFDNMTPSDHKYFLRLEELYFKDFDPRIFSPYDTILDKLEEVGKLDYSKSGSVGVYTHLIKLLGEKSFNENFTQGADYHENYDDFYYGYHKQFRQADMFYFSGCEQIGRSFYEKNKEKWDKRADEMDGEIIQGGTYHIFPIGGHLDSIFWNMIHSDSEVWDRVLKYTYTKYQHSKEKTNEK